MVRKAWQWSRKTLMMSVLSGRLLLSQVDKDRLPRAAVPQNRMVLRRYMMSKYVLALVAMVILCVGSPARGEQEGLALLGELIPCPMVIGSTQLEFSSDAPPGLMSAPHCTSGLLFAILRMGGRYVYVALCEGQADEPRLWVDTQGDGDLTDEGDGRPGWRWGWQGFTWLSTVSLPYDTGDAIAYAVRFSAMPRFGASDPPWFSVHMYTGGYRQGLLQIGDQIVPFGAATIDPQGYFHDLDKLFFLVDWNKNGELDAIEVMPASIPFLVDGEPYMVMSAGPCGRRVHGGPCT